MSSMMEKPRPTRTERRFGPKGDRQTASPPDDLQVKAFQDSLLKLGSGHVLFSRIGIGYLG